MDAFGGTRWLTWQAVLAAGLAAVVARIAIPSTRAGQAFVVACSGACLAAAWIGVARIPGAHRGPPALFAAGLTVYFCGDLFFYYYLLVRQSPRPFPSVADALYLSDLPVFIAAVLMLVRRQRRGRDVASLIDGALVATAAGLASWVFVIRPTVAASTSLTERVIGMAYPLLDVVLFTVAVRLLLIRGRRPVAHVLLAAAVLSLTVGDALYNFLNVLPGLPLLVEPYYVLFLLWYVLAATALLHPSMGQESAAGAAPATELDRGRLAFMGAVVLSAPIFGVVNEVRGNRRDVITIGVVSVALFLLLMVRMTLLMRSLRRAEQAAVAANEAKSTFLATISHEIRTPLNAVINVSGLLAESDLEAEQRSLAQEVESSAQSLAALIEDILDFSKIESGTFTLASEPFEVRACVESAVAVVARQAEEQGLAITVRFSADTPGTVQGDEARLRQVLVNLLSNAVKFTDVGAVSVFVRSHPLPRSLGGSLGDGTGEATHLYVAVRDTGVGIPAAAHDRVFQSFFQVDASATRRHGGTGLGLAISRRLCELMGGRMWFDSEEGLGSTFHFTVAAPSAAPVPARIGLRAVPGGELSPVQQLRVLVAEDNPVNQRVMQLLLDRLGHRATVVAGGREVLAALDEADYDVILMDMQMPDLDGLETTRRIRRIRPSGRPRIIAVTAGAVAGDRERCLAAGMDDYLSKPFTRHHLAAVLRRVDRVALSPPAGSEGSA